MRTVENKMFSQKKTLPSVGKRRPAVFEAVRGAIKKLGKELTTVKASMLSENSNQLSETAIQLFLKLLREQLRN